MNEQIITETLYKDKDQESVTKQNQQRVKPRKQRITVQISEEVIERIKNAVYWTPGLTLASLAEEAFAKVVDALEEEKRSTISQEKRGT